MSPAVWSQLPNALTVLRVVLAGAFFAALNLFRYPGHQVVWGNVAIGLFIAAAITDALDGYLARKWRVESVFGRVMDPFCDKVLIIGAFIYLAGPRFAVETHRPNGEIIITMVTSIYPWMVVIILARELLVTGIRGIIEGMGASGASLWSGKAKMITQCITIPLIMFLAVNCLPTEREWARIACIVLAYSTLIVTVWSGLPYIGGLRKMIAQPKAATPRENVSAR